MLQKIKVPIILQEQVPSDNNAQTDTATDTSATAETSTVCSDYQDSDSCPSADKCRWDFYDEKCKDETQLQTYERELNMKCVSHFDYVMIRFGYVLFGLICLGVAFLLMVAVGITYWNFRYGATYKSEYFTDAASVLTSISQL